MRKLGHRTLSLPKEGGKLLLAFHHVSGDGLTPCHSPGSFSRQRRRSDLRAVTISCPRLPSSKPSPEVQSPSSPGKLTEPSQWKSFRHELLMYLEHFLMAIINGCKLSAPALKTEVMWESFVDCLKNQGLIFSGTGKTQDYCLTNAALSQPLYLMLDDNFYYQSMRYEVYQLARKYSSGFCQLFLDCPIESCLERNRQRSKPVPDDIIQLMARKIESPNIQKNAWEHNSLTVRSTRPCSDDNTEVIDLLITALKNPIRYFEENVEQKETDRIICSTNILHQADQKFRRIISQTMKKAKDEKVIAYKLKLLAEELNKLKTDFLDDLRQGNSKRISCFHQNSISDVIRLFHYERDNIVQKYIPNEY
ncbi:L-seryl-tRNA(Sec) kinase isoform X2 [Sminthopsis crassicaudata]|uniref:L-seryl-tRNA(Sec) kinase isoform X2 n=1 Tax=Sminthopsis crassicaudata TaxID=9301 RepID=UPI003D698452